jgi:hypothetical protein
VEVKMTAAAIATCRDWHFLYVNALLEPNAHRLPDRITAAEHAIKECLKSFVHRSDDDPRKMELMDALQALHGLKARRIRIDQ